VVVVHPATRRPAITRRHMATRVAEVDVFILIPFSHDNCGSIYLISLIPDQYKANFIYNPGEY